MRDININQVNNDVEPSLPLMDPIKVDGKFHNPRPIPSSNFFRRLKLTWYHLFQKHPNSTPSHVIPVQEISRQQLLDASDQTLYRLGHSTLLFKLDNELWLTDPVFSERASPFSQLGPKRFHQSPISIAELPCIKGVILSHDHYDHLDYQAILALADKVEYFLAPIGVGQRLIQWGIPANKVQELDWWAETQIGGIRFIATPARHFSGRSLTDANKTLWVSWVIIASDLRLFFSGDSGYFEGFKHIGDMYGPFDLTMIETGGYDKEWPDVHMNPEETLRAHQDLRGRWLLPIHNGTFDLSLHSWDDPFEKITQLAVMKNIAISTPQMGEEIAINAPSVGSHWWKMAKDEESEVYSYKEEIA